MNYRCAKCGVAVVRMEKEFIRACSHSDDGVVAELSAATKGISSLNRDESELETVREE